MKLFTLFFCLFLLAAFSPSTFAQAPSVTFAVPSTVVVANNNPVDVFAMVSQPGITGAKVGTVLWTVDFATQKPAYKVGQMNDGSGSGITVRAALKLTPGLHLIGLQFTTEPTGWAAFAQTQVTVVGTTEPRLACTPTPSSATAGGSVYGPFTGYIQLVASGGVDYHWTPPAEGFMVNHNPFDPTDSILVVQGIKPGTFIFKVQSGNETASCTVMVQ